MPFRRGKEEPAAVELLEIIGVNLQLLSLRLLVGLVAHHDRMAVDDALQQGGEMGVAGKGIVVLKTHEWLGSLQGTVVRDGLQGGEHPLPLRVLLVGIAVTLTQHLYRPRQGIMVGRSQFQHLQTIRSIRITVAITLFQHWVEFHIVRLRLQRLHIELHSPPRHFLEVVTSQFTVAAINQIPDTIQPRGILEAGIEHLVAQHFISVKRHILFSLITATKIQRKTELKRK